MQNLKVNGQRLWRSLMDLAQVGATPKGGVCRLALTGEDKAARDLFVRWCHEAGCEISIDTIGNVIARRPGRNPALPPVMTGSHLDTQPTGGRFDGAFGVMAGLEVVRTLNDLGIETEAPIEVVAWTNEEGSRFAPCMMGSGVFTGKISLEDALAKTDSMGIRQGDALRDIGYAGTRPATGHAVAAYFEAHIEQGPVLEAEGKTVGVVLGALGQRWFDITIIGQEAHAGPTPMALRRDALVAAAAVIAEVNRIGHAHQPHACATVGYLRVHPNSRNVIPGQVALSVDFRHLTGQALQAMDDDLRAFLVRLAVEGNIGIGIEIAADFPPAHFHPDCIAAVRRAAEAGGHLHRDIVSGAGHDAVFMADICPAAMVFVPCENGISHNEIENAKPSDLAAGCDVLLAAVLDRAGIATSSEPRSSRP